MKLGIRLSNNLTFPVLLEYLTHYANYISRGPERFLTRLGVQFVRFHIKNKDLTEVKVFFLCQPLKCLQATT